MTSSDRTDQTAANGAAVAAFLAAGIGAFAMGVVVILNETGIFAAPSLYAPSGGVSGRTTIAVVIWAIAWGVLHAKWNGRTVEPGRVYVATLVLTGIGVLLCFPPLWGLL